MNYNYIVEVEQNKNINVQFNNPTAYSNGDIYGFFITCKNMYNSLYSMSMNSATRIQNCRDYIGILNGGDKILLKFYDDVSYDIQLNNLSNAEALLDDSSDESTKTYPYQKIESYDPTSFGYGSYNKHKSNLFSIKIHNSGLDDESIN